MARTSIFQLIVFCSLIIFLTAQAQKNIGQISRTLYSKFRVDQIHTIPLEKTSSDHLFYSCTEKCRIIQFNMIDIDTCMQKCSEESKFKIFITELFIGIISIIVVILVIYTEICKDSSNPVSDIEDCGIAQRIILKQKYFEEQIKYKNKVCTNNISQEQFQSLAKHFPECKWIFSCPINGNPHIIRNYTIKLKKIESFIYELVIGGNYELGTWSMSGYYLNTIRGIQIWAMKNYEYPDYAGQAQQWDRLMFEGHKNQNGNYEGNWYYVGFQNNPQYSSKWLMEAPNTLKQLKEIKEILIYE